MTTGKRIRLLRRSKGVTQTELGQAIGVGKTTISNYETGYSSPDTETLSKMAQYFNVTTDYLLGREPRGQMMLQEARFPYLADDLPNLDLDEYLMDIREAVGKAVAAGDIEPEQAENIVQETFRYLLFQIEQLKKNVK